MKINAITRGPDLTELCSQVRELVGRKKYDQCSTLICRAMEHYPSAPQPHNLLGVVLEKQGDHAGAMRHFRAAWALDPTYSPANQNLTVYGTFYSCGTTAFDETDCRQSESSRSEIKYDDMGIGRVRRRE